MGINSLMVECLDNEASRLNGTLSLMGAFFEQMAKQNDDLKDEILGVKNAFDSLMLSSINELLSISNLAKEQGN